jgi:hypothetical protein
LLLEDRFGALPAPVSGRIERSEDGERLKACILRAPHLDSPDGLDL